MKFIVSSSSLLKHLQQIGGVINANTVLPILEDFLFEITLPLIWIMLPIWILELTWVFGIWTNIFPEHTLLSNHASIYYYYIYGNLYMYIFKKIIKQIENL